jgi:PPP family 3-phenylpropionic acid transporter
MQGLGLNALEIGQVMAAIIGTKIIAPYFFGWLADHTGRMMLWVRVAMGLATLTAAGLVWAEDFGSLLFVVLLFSFFWHGGLPLFEAYTFSQLGSKKAQYGKIRLWGSLGFIAAVLMLGGLFSQWGLSGFPWVILALFLLLSLVTFSLRDQVSHVTQAPYQSLWPVLLSPAVLALLAVSFLIQFSHGTYYNFFSIHLTDYGYSTQAIAGLWTLGVVAEIFVFLAMVWLLRHISILLLLMSSLVLTLLRWQLSLWGVESLLALLVAQIFHAASFGLYHAVALHLIDNLFQGGLRSRGQAVYAATSQGLGGAVGALVAGLTWSLGGALLSYSISSIAVLIAIVIVWFGLRRLHVY